MLKYLISLLFLLLSHHLRCLRDCEKVSGWFYGIENASPLLRHSMDLGEREIPQYVIDVRRASTNLDKYAP